MGAPTDNKLNSSCDASNRAARLRADTLVSSVVLLLGVSIIQRGVGFGRGVLFCRWLSPDQLGLWEMAYSFLLFAAPLAVLGLPGSFGRYLERYRSQGQLRVFLRRTTIWTASLTVSAIAAICVAAPQISSFIYGTPNKTTETMIVAVSLGAVIAHHFLEALFTAMRMYRVVSAMQFAHSILFATIGLGLIAFWRAEAISIVIAYGGSCAISAATAVLWRFSASDDEAETVRPISHRDFWPPLVRFAVWVWMSNLLCNLFGIVDRYMIVHFGGMAPDDAMSQVGNYHSSRIVPLLMVSIADLLAGIVLPYLSKDWEAGRRETVSRRLNFVIKMAAIGMIAGSVAILVGAPLLFEFAFEGKYDGGLAVLPMTLCYCTMFGVTVIAQSYLWTAEKARQCSIPMAIGLTANIGLNLMLLPLYGLPGAVLATTVANFLCLASTLWLCRLNGMEIDRATLVLCFAPLAICGGLEIASAVFFALLLSCSTDKGLLRSDEQTQLRETLASGLDRVVGRRKSPSTTRPAS